MSYKLFNQKYTRVMIIVCIMWQLMQYFNIARPTHAVRVQLLPALHLGVVASSFKKRTPFAIISTT